MYKESIRYTSKGGKICPPSKHEPIHNQQLNKNGEGESKTGRQNRKGKHDVGRRQNREGGQGGRTEAKENGRKDGGRVWNNEKKEDDRIRYPPTKFLTKPI